ncbi:MAG: hypothetical protein WCS30_06020 [Selenomonadaceae bacterium]
MSNLFFHIHYCKCRQFNKLEKPLPKITRKIQHHEIIFFTRGKGVLKIDKAKELIIEGNKMVR